LSNSALVWSVIDKNFYSTPDDVLRQLDGLKTALKASVTLLQKKVQMRIPSEENLHPRNVVTVMKGRSARVEIVPYIHKRPPGSGGLKIFNRWATMIEYKKKPFARPAFDSAQNDIIAIFDMALGRIK
jgi:hypothetical protein